ncbi:hypothetical protein BB558_000526 [Smittium angustum]|uniref:SAP domain-containing protein n=1 Tax=Smittium angustum TaxID=133377 RepID=A0A2U1JDW6_SMIAN|nr:hypothetical protein BB558_000526 [Smittium angustum]
MGQKLSLKTYFKTQKSSPDSDDFAPTKQKRKTKPTKPTKLSYYDLPVELDENYQTGLALSLSSSSQSSYFCPDKNSYSPNNTSKSRRITRPLDRSDVLPVIEAKQHIENRALELMLLDQTVNDPNVEQSTHVPNSSSPKKQIPNGSLWQLASVDHSSESSLYLTSTLESDVPPKTNSPQNQLDSLKSKFAAKLFVLLDQYILEKNQILSTTSPFDLDISSLKISPGLEPLSTPYTLSKHPMPPFITPKNNQTIPLLSDSSDSDTRFSYLNPRNSSSQSISSIDDKFLNNYLKSESPSYKSPDKPFSPEYQNIQTNLHETSNRNIPAISNIDYSSMTFQQLKTEASKYGLRVNTSKKLLVIQLTKIQNVINSKKNQTTPQKHTPQNNPHQINTYKNPTPNSSKKKLTSELQKVLFQFITSDTNLYNSILLYKPVETDTLFLKIKNSGIKNLSCFRFRNFYS